jgi:hypothetical protein
MIWEFKLMLYNSHMRAEQKRVESLADPQVRAAIQRHLDSQPGTPPEGADNEYSYYFQRAFPYSDDRRLHVGRVVGAKQPNVGYLCLAALGVAKKVRFIWTPNFDTMVEQAFAILNKGEIPPVVGRDTSARLRIHLRDEAFPVIIKLHGDFRVDSLQNTEEELASLDQTPGDVFVDFAKVYGLVVVGYSGRDCSVMDAIERALAEHGRDGFPHGFYWCLRWSDHPPARVESLIVRAQALGIRAGLVRIDGWDQFAALLYQSCGLSHPRIEDAMANRERGTRRGAPPPKPVLPAHHSPSLGIVEKRTALPKPERGRAKWHAFPFVVATLVVAGVIMGFVLAHSHSLQQQGLDLTRHIGLSLQDTASGLPMTTDTAQTPDTARHHPPGTPAAPLIAPPSSAPAPAALAPENTPARIRPQPRAATPSEQAEIRNTVARASEAWATAQYRSDRAVLEAVYAGRQIRSLVAVIMDEIQRDKYVETTLLEENNVGLATLFGNDSASVDVGELTKSIARSRSSNACLLVRDRIHSHSTYTLRRVDDGNWKVVAIDPIGSDSVEPGECR